MMQGVRVNSREAGADTGFKAQEGYYGHEPSDSGGHTLLAGIDRHAVTGQAIRFDHEEDPLPH